MFISRDADKNVQERALKSFLNLTKGSFPIIDLKDDKLTPVLLHFLVDSPLPCTAPHPPAGSQLEGMFLSFLGLGRGPDYDAAGTGLGGSKIMRRALTCVYSSEFTKHSRRWYLPSISFHLCDTGALAPISQRGQVAKAEWGCTPRACKAVCLFWIKQPFTVEQ